MHESISVIEFHVAFFFAKKMRRNQRASSTGCALPALCVRDEMVWVAKNNRIHLQLETSRWRGWEYSGSIDRSTYDHRRATLASIVPIFSLGSITFPGWPVACDRFVIPKFCAELEHLCHLCIAPLSSSCKSCCRGAMRSHSRRDSLLSLTNKPSQRVCYRRPTPGKTHLGTRYPLQQTGVKFGTGGSCRIG